MSFVCRTLTLETSSRMRTSSTLSRIRTFSSVPSTAPVTESDVLAHQSNWSSAICDISSKYLAKEDFVSAAASHAGDLYNYGNSPVLFKPTKATNHPFRPTPEEAMSYFVGGTNVPDGYTPEDGGFAINGGSGWSAVEFINSSIYLDGGLGFACGVYDFTCSTTGEVSRVEYTKGYKRGPDGKVRLFLHHSSVPFGK